MSKSFKQVSHNDTPSHIASLVQSPNSVANNGKYCSTRNWKCLLTRFHLDLLALWSYFKLVILTCYMIQLVYTALLLWRNWILQKLLSIWNRINFCVIQSCEHNCIASSALQLTPKDALFKQVILQQLHTRAIYVSFMECVSVLYLKSSKKIS